MEWRVMLVQVVSKHFSCKLIVVELKFTSRYSLCTFVMTNMVIDILDGTDCLRKPVNCILSKMCCPYELRKTHEFERRKNCSKLCSSIPWKYF